LKVPVYNPGTCAAATVRVPPTVKASVPFVAKVWLRPPEHVIAVTAIVSAPLPVVLVMLKEAVGIVIV
jgi:hypothetical protein